MDIIFNPPANEANQYIQLLVSELRAKGYRIHSLDTIFSSRKHFRSIKLVHLNWFENIVERRSFFTELRSFLRKLTVLTIIHLSGKPLIWTLHNRESHEKGTAFFSRIITRLLVRWSDCIVIHSGQSEGVLTAYGGRTLERVAYVPHPHFIGVYGDALTATRGDNLLRLLFIGMVKPYKNLELLIDVVGAFGHRVQLIIAGKAVDENYQRKLVEQANAVGNVTLLPYFVPDGELAQLLGRADAVVLPYDLASSLNSGTVILAFSYKKTVICPEIGTVSDLDSHMADTFCYRYGTTAQHRAELTQQIERALVLKQHDPDALDNRGERLYRHMVMAHDPHRVGDELARLYRHVVDKHLRS